jgi:hypothetical protein
MNGSDQTLSKELLLTIVRVVRVIALPTLTMFVIAKVGVPEFDRIAKAAAHGSASEAFFTTGAGVAATLLVASTIAATTILSRVPRDRDLAVVHVLLWAILILIACAALTTTLGASLVALDHCRTSTSRGVVCGTETDTGLAALGLTFGLLLLPAQIIYGSLHRSARPAETRVPVELRQLLLSDENEMVEG